MEADLGLAAGDHGSQALAERETACYSGTRPHNLGLFHTGRRGGPNGQGERTIFGLNTAIQAVGEGNYGRLGPGRQQRYTDAEAEPMFGQPYTGETPDEQPGSLPEILPSPDFGANIDRCWTCCAMFVQAWGHYGTAWPVVHQQLGVRPDLGRGSLEVVPQPPPGQSPLAGSNIRLAGGSADVAAERDGSTHRTSVDVDVSLSELALGHTLRPDARVSSVTLDGRPAKYRTERTNRGLEVLAEVRGREEGRHLLVVKTRG
jgi:hypothetical protein